jgi:hypothetical protein
VVGYDFSTTGGFFMSRHIHFWVGSCSTALMVLLSATTAWGAESTCKQTLAELDASVKMPARDRESFLKDCGTQARRTCKHEAKQLKLDANARTAHIEQCTKAKVG